MTKFWEGMKAVHAKIPPVELLAQLAEESCELAHAALKARRAMEALENINPTPVPLHDALDNLAEELRDVQLTALACGFRMATEKELEPKMERWKMRIRKDGSE